MEIIYFIIGCIWFVSAWNIGMYYEENQIGFNIVSFLVMFLPVVNTIYIIYKFRKHFKFDFKKYFKEL